MNFCVYVAQCKSTWKMYQVERGLSTWGVSIREIEIITKNFLFERIRLQWSCYSYAYFFYYSYFHLIHFIISDLYFQNTSFYDLDLYLNRGCLMDNYNTPGFLVTYNINNGVQIVGHAVDPPPYSEV